MEMLSRLHLSLTLRGHKQIVELLLDLGVPQEHLDVALHAALENDNKHIGELLVKHGARKKELFEPVNVRYIL